MAAAGDGSLPFLAVAGDGSLPFLAAAGDGSLPFGAAAVDGSLPFRTALGVGTLSMTLPGALDPLPLRVGVDTIGPMAWVAEVLAWVLPTLARREGGEGREEVNGGEEKLLRDIGVGRGRRFGSGGRGSGCGRCLLCLGAGAWAGCCCEVDGCWVSECLSLCTLGGDTDTVGEDTGDVCMVVRVVSASEVCVLIGVLVMAEVDEDVVHASVSVDATGMEVEGEEGDTVEAVAVEGLPDNRGMLHNLALRRHMPFLQEEEAGDGHVAAVEPVDSEDEEAEDEDNRTAVIQQYFQ
ncbi:hypothetical protein NDU88_005069 [Pleurodeles waltl]|uniref:Uncharacterized protein n=1 Tax=Pleurodeles waltl TaxID=8319 RepID=A0AAV7WU65_PLEWA|nr:hypothetical protein NDU88_005069 [Pleurodeles waltl]